MDSGLAAVNNKRGVGQSGNAQMRNMLLGSSYGEVTMVKEEVPFGTSHGGNVPMGGGGVGYGWNKGRFAGGETRGRSSSLNSSVVNLFKGRLKHSKGGGGMVDDEKDMDEEITMSDDAAVVTFNDLTTLRNNGGHKYGYGGAMDDTTPIIPTLATSDAKGMGSNEYRKHVNAQKKMVFNSMARQTRQQVQPFQMGMGGVGAGPGGSPLAPGGGRAMSLQSYNQPPPMGQFNSYGNGGIPGQNVAPYGSRVPAPKNSPPGGPSRYRPGPPMVMGANGSRSMSLGGRGMPPKMSGPIQGPVSGNYQPSPRMNGPMPVNMNYHQYHHQQQLPPGGGPRSMSLQNQPPPNMYANVESMRYPPPHSINHSGSTSASSYGTTISMDSESIRRSSSGTETTDIAEEPEIDTMFRLKSPLMNEVIREEAVSPPGTLNLLKLATPKQEQLQNTGERERDPLGTLEERASNSFNTAPVGYKVNNINKSSPPKQQPVDQSAFLRTEPSKQDNVVYTDNKENSEGKVQNFSNNEQNSLNSEQLDGKDDQNSEIDLSPSSALIESLQTDDFDDFSKSFPWMATDSSSSDGKGSEPTTYDSKNARTQSNFSQFSHNDSVPLRENKNSNITYGITGQSSEDKAFATASGLRIKEQNPQFKEPKPNMVSRISDSTITEADNVHTIPERTYDEQDTKSNGFVKAKNFLRKISSRSKEPSSTLSTPSPNRRKIGNSSSLSAGRRLSWAGSLKSIISFDGNAAVRRKQSLTPSEDEETPDSLDNHVLQSPVDKRRSFHSLFSGSSGSHLNNVQNSTPVNRPSRSNSYFRERSESKSRSNTAANFLTPSSNSFKCESLSNMKKPVLHEDAKISEDDRGQETAADNKQTASNYSDPPGQLYPPIFASGQDELEPAVFVGNYKGTTKFKTIYISEDQLNLIKDSKNLMHELHIVSQELAESVAREAWLEKQISDRQASQEARNLSIVDFEIELRKKSSKIVELIQALNEERLKRFIAEEQVLLRENGVKPSHLDLVYKIDQLQTTLQAKNVEIKQLKDKLSTK